jgi:glycosyltransferase involved in cell wall biosynthesis
MEIIMNDKPLISVVIPTYNRLTPTLEAISSVLAQTYETLEVIVVDDGSIDGSGDAIREFVERKAGCEGQKRKVHYFRQHNQGSSAARNTGVRHAKGSYIAFLDSDDSWLPDKLDLQMQAIKEFEREGSACFTDARCVSKSGMDVGTFESFGRGYIRLTGIDRGAVNSLAKAFCGFWISTLLVEADTIRRVGGFNPAIIAVEDRDFFFRLSLATSLIYVNLPLVCVDRSSSPPGSCARPWDKAEVRIRGNQRMYESWLGLKDVPQSARKIIVRGLQATHCDWTNLHVEYGQYDKARKDVSRAFRFGPSPKIIAKWTITWLAPFIARRIFAKSKPYLS